MSIIYVAKELISNPYLYYCRCISSMGLLDKMTDKQWIKISWKLKVACGGGINLKNPTGFNEKLQWLKLYDRRPEYSVMVDKYRVRNYVADRIGEQFLIPLLGVWEDADAIDFNLLPNQFVIKCTHNSGEGMYLCKDKSTIDCNRVKDNIRKALKKNYYFDEREWPYKNVHPRVIAEKYMIDSSLDNKRYSLISYKFYCFNGEPKFFYIGVDDISAGAKGESLLTFVDMEWNVTEFQRSDHRPYPLEIKKTENFEKMVMVAKALAKDIPFVRVDLYDIEGSIYFSEMTFCPGGGFGLFYPDEWEKKIGDLLVLPDS